MHITGNGVTVNNLTERVAEQLLPQMRAETKQSAPANYARIRADFNKTAKTLTKALEAANPDMDTRALAQADDKTRKAWLEQPILAQQLDGHLEALQAAAELTGANITTGLRSAQSGSIAEQIKSRTIGLTIDTNGAHRRKVWEAWDNTTNAGRWAALHELGCTIEAIKDPEELEPYRKPAPIEIYHEQVAPGSYRVNLERDPEDAEYEQQRFKTKKQTVNII